MSDEWRDPDEDEEEDPLATGFREVIVGEGVSVTLLEGESGTGVSYDQGDITGGAGWTPRPELSEGAIRSLVDSKIVELESTDPKTNAILDRLGVLYEWKRRRTRSSE